MYKLYKIVKKCKILEKRLIQVFHIEIAKKGGKNDVLEILSTLSTKASKTGDYSRQIKERMFCEVIIKIRFCRKKPK